MTSLFGNYRARLSTVACAASLFALGCASSSTASSGGSSTPASTGGSSSSSTKTNAPAAATRPVEQDAVVTLKPGSFPPVNVDAWVCEPRSWTEKDVNLHCSAPAGTTGLVDSLKAQPEVASADLAK